MPAILHDNLKRVVVKAAQLTPTPNADGQIVAYGDDRVPVFVVERPGTDESRQLASDEYVVQFPPFVASAVRARGNGAAIAVGTDLSHFITTGTHGRRFAPAGDTLAGHTVVEVSSAVSATVLVGTVAEDANSDVLTVLFK